MLLICTWWDDLSHRSKLLLLACVLAVDSAFNIAECTVYIHCLCTPIPVFKAAQIGSWWSDHFLSPNTTGQPFHCSAWTNPNLGMERVMTRLEKWLDSTRVESLNFAWLESLKSWLVPSLNPITCPINSRAAIVSSLNEILSRPVPNEGFKDHVTR